MKKTEDDKKEAQVTGVERDILKELREMVQATGASGFHFRVQKKMENGPMSFVGNLDGGIEDIPQALLDKWKDGQYRLYAHFNDKKKIPNVPPLDYAVGVLGQTAGGDKEPASRRIKELDEEIEVRKRERELRRAEKELRRLESEEEGGGERDEILEAMQGFELEIENLRRENEELKSKTREDRLMSEIAALKKQMEDGGSHKRDPEIEALKLRLAAAEESARKAEMDAMKRGFEGQIGELKALLANQSTNRWGAKDYAAAAAPFVPAMTAWIEKSAGGKKEALEIVEKVTGVLKTQPKGLELKELIPMLTPIIGPLLSRKDESIPAILGLVGNLVGPMVEAAAEAASHPPSGDDLGASISKVIGMIQRSISDTKDMQSKTLEVEKTRLKTAEKLAGRMPRVPGAPPPRSLPVPPPGAPRPPAGAPQRAAPPTAPARPPRPPVRATTPLVGFANRMAQAIGEQDEEVEFYVGMAEKELPPDDLARLEQYKDASMFSSYLGGLPGVDGAPFQTQYGKRWLTAFLAAVHGEQPPALAPMPVPKPASIAPPVPAPAPAVSPNVTKLPPRDANDVPSNVKLNEFKYPADSKVDVVEMDGLELPIEYPTAETIAKREQERLQVTGRST